MFDAPGINRLLHSCMCRYYNHPMLVSPSGGG